MDLPSDLSTSEEINAGGMDEQIRAGLNQAIAAVEAHQTGGEGLAEPAAPIEQEIVKPMVTPTKPAAIGMPAPKEEPYEFAHCTISIGITLMPDDGHAEGRRIAIGARDHNEAGILRTVRLKDLTGIARIIEEVIAEETASLEKRKTAKASKSSKSPKPAAAAPAAKPAAKIPAKGAPKSDEHKPAASQITISFEQ